MLSQIPKTFRAVVGSLLLMVAVASFSGSATQAAIADDAIDTSFGSSGYVTVLSATRVQSEPNAIAELSDGRIIVSFMEFDGSTMTSETKIRAYDSSGQPDSSFGTGGIVSLGTSTFVVSLQPIAGGGFFVGTVNGDILKFSASGAPDTSFDGDGKATAPVGGASAPAYSFSFDPSSGAIVTTGENTSGWSRITRFTATGGSPTATQVASTTDAVSIKVGDRLYVAGSTSTGNYFGSKTIIRAYTWASASTGSPTLDTNFLSSNSGSAAPGIWTPGSSTALDSTRVFDIDVDASGKLLVSMFQLAGSVYKVLYLRIDPTASTSAAALDASFGTAGIAEAPLTALNPNDPWKVSGGSYIQSNGKITSIVETGVVRMTSAGAADLTFDTDGKIETAYAGGQPVETTFKGLVTSGGQIIRFYRDDDGSGFANQDRFRLKLVRYGAPPITAPGAPSISGITAGNGSLSVNFNAPSSNGGATITNYEYSVDEPLLFQEARLPHSDLSRLPA